MSLSENFKFFIKSFQTILKQHNEFYQKKLQHRCEIVRVQKNSQMNTPEILVRMMGVKNQALVKFSPEEILVNDALLMEFSQTDVRAITFCALKNEKDYQTQHSRKFRIISQELERGKSIFVIAEEGTAGESRVSAHELFISNRLPEFSFEDMRNIIYTATSEQLEQEQEFLVNGN